MDDTRTTDSLGHDAEPSIDPIKAVRMLHSAGGVLYDQATRPGERARLGWIAETRRLLRMCATAMFGFACALCMLLFVGVVVLSASWDTVYRVPAMLMLTVFYAGGVGIAWHRLQSLSALGGQAFAASSDEVAADLALLKRRL